MTAARKLVSTALRSGLPSWLHIDKARTPDRTDKPTCIIWTSQLTRFDRGGKNWLRSTVELWVLVPTGTSLDTLEDRLDDQLNDVLAVLEDEPNMAWTTADRGVLGDDLHGWHLQLTVLHQIT